MMTQSDFIRSVLGQIIDSENEMRMCSPEYYPTIAARRNAFCDVLRVSFGNNTQAILEMVSILGDLRAGEIDREINQIMGVDYVGRDNQ